MKQFWITIRCVINCIHNLCLDERNVKYVMCNAFEKQIPTENKNDIVPYHLLNKKYYYKPESSMYDELKR